MFDEVLKTGAVADRLMVDIKTVSNWIKFGVRGVRLKARKVGGNYHIRRVDLDDFLAACEGKPVVSREEPTPTERDRINRRNAEQLISEGW